MKLSEWCKNEGIDYKTGWNWFKSGKLPVSSYQTATGTILVQPKDNLIKNEIKNAALYCRVSSRDKKDDLDRQAVRCEEFAIKNGFKIKNTYKEIASGMNDTRPMLTKLLESNIDYIIVENKDRLTRFGFNYIKVLYSRLGTEIVVINQANCDKEDLMKDLISIITSFCGRIYGLRRTKSLTDQAKKIFVTPNDKEK